MRHDVGGLLGYEETLFGAKKTHLPTADDYERYVKTVCSSKVTCQRNVPILSTTYDKLTSTYNKRP